VTTNVLERLSADLSEVCRVKVIAPCAAITLVGRGMRSLLHKLSDVWATFGQERVHLISQSSNDLNLTFVIDEADAEGMLPQLHAELIRGGAMPVQAATVFGPSWKDIAHGKPERRLRWWAGKREALLRIAGTGTPRYAYDLATVRERARDLAGIDAIDRRFFAIKANPHPAILRTLVDEGFGLECVSLGELEHVFRHVPGLAPERVVFTPSFAPKHEYEAAFARGATVTLDNVEALRHWPDVFRDRTLWLRLDLGHGEGHHEKVKTGGVAAKFGLSLARFDEFVEEARALGIRISGLHAHLGSGIDDPRHWRGVYAELAGLADGIGTVETIDIGGGLPVAYTPDAQDFDLAAYRAGLEEIRAAYPRFLPGDRTRALPRRRVRRAAPARHPGRRKGRRAARGLRRRHERPRAPGDVRSLPRHPQPVALRRWRRHDLRRRRPHLRKRRRARPRPHAPARHERGRRPPGRRRRCVRHGDGKHLQPAGPAGRGHDRMTGWTFSRDAIRAFRFVDCSFDAASGVARLVYAFDDGPELVETVTLPGAPFTLDAAREAAMQRALRLLHLIAGVSYYKAAVPLEIRIEGTPIDAATAALLESLYLNGLGEFAYRNGLHLHDRIRFPHAAADAQRAPAVGLQRHALVAIGGGKDSLVSIEALRSIGVSQTVAWVGGSQLIKACAERTGLPTLNIGRALAPALFEYNRQGAWNGHIPVTAVNSAILALAAIVLGADQVVFSNERSASYGSLIPGTGEVNHQWSKGWAWEQALGEHIQGLHCRGPALLLVAAPAERAGRRAPVRAHGPLRRALLQLQPQFPPAGGTPREPLVRRLPEVPLRVPRARTFHVEAAPGAHFRPQPAGRSGAGRGYDALLEFQDHKPFECVGEGRESRAAMAALADRPEWREDALVERFAREIRRSSIRTTSPWNPCSRWTMRIAFRPRCGSPCVRISQLDGKRVALWGWGREGRAAYRALRARLPALPLTLFCDAREAARPRRSAMRCCDATRVDAMRSSAFDVVVKSPASARIATKRARPSRAARASSAAPRCGSPSTRARPRPHRLRDRHEGQEHDDGLARAPAARGRPSHRARGQHRLAAARTARRRRLRGRARVLGDRTVELPDRRRRRQRCASGRARRAQRVSRTPRLARRRSAYVADKLRLITDAQPRVAVLNAADPRSSRSALGRTRRALVRSRRRLAPARRRAVSRRSA
jgi:hypothetical protein